MAAKPQAKLAQRCTIKSYFKVDYRNSSKQDDVLVMDNPLNRGHSKENREESSSLVHIQQRTVDTMWNLCPSFVLSWKDLVEQKTSITINQWQCNFLNQSKESEDSSYLQVSLLLNNM